MRSRFLATPIGVMFALLFFTGCGAQVAQIDAPSPDVAEEISRPDTVSPEPVDAGPPWERVVNNPIWTLTVHPSDIARLEADVFAEVSVPGTLIAEGAIYNLEVELQGGSSRVYPKKNLRLKFSSKAPFMGDPFDDGGEDKGFDRLILRASWKDQSYVREALAFEALRRIGVDAPRVSWINLKLNDDYWGLYAVVEPVDMDFIKRRGLRKNGVLYKAVDQAAGFKPSVRVEEGYETKHAPNDTDHDYDDLLTLLQLLWDTPVNHDDYVKTIDPIFSLERYMKRLMWASYTQNGDSIRHNYYLYHEPSLWPDNPETEGRWWIFAWDSDICFGNHWKVEEKMEPVENDTMLNGPAFLSERFAEIEPLRHAFIETYQGHLDSVWSTDAMMTIAEGMFERNGDDVARDLAHWRRPSQVDEEFDEIRMFLVERPKILLPLLAEFYENPDIDEIDP